MLDDTGAVMLVEGVYDDVIKSGVWCQCLRYFDQISTLLVSLLVQQTLLEALRGQTMPRGLPSCLVAFISWVSTDVLPSILMHPSHLARTHASAPGVSAQALGL